MRQSAPERLAESVKAYFATAMKELYSSAPGERPDRLVYLLDHQYTPSGLAWNRLKNADRLRAKLEPDPSAPRHLVTIRGVGYRFDGNA